MKIAFLFAISAVGIWYNIKATRHWWSVQKSHIPGATDVAGWFGLAFSVVWYLFVFVFFAGLTINNTLLR